MVSGLPGPFAKLGYGTFYLPALSFGYLYTQPDSAAYSPQFQTLEIFSYSLNIGFQYSLTASDFLLLFLISLIGAVQIHGLTRSIYGPDAEEGERKLKSVTKREMLSMTTYLRAYLPTGKKFRRMANPTLYVSDGNNSSFYHDLEKLSNDAGIPVLLISLIKLIFFIPMFILRLLFWISTILLWFAVLSTPTYISLILFSAQFSYHFKGILWTSFPEPTGSYEYTNVSTPTHDIDSKPYSNPAETPRINNSSNRSRPVFRGPPSRQKDSSNRDNS